MAAKNDYNLKSIRNIGIIAHIDAGKTTTTEHLLYYAGSKHKLGGVDEGTTETDFDVEEQERGITIYSACVPLSRLEHTVNLIDTPGHVDFTAEVERSLRVLDGCVCVFDAQKGVEAQSETVWRQANKYSVPRLVFVNKMDVVGANFGNCLSQVRDRLEGHPVPLTIPIGSGSPKDSSTPFKGIVDLLTMKAIFFDAASHGKTFREEEIPADLMEGRKEIPRRTVRRSHSRTTKKTASPAPISKGKTCRWHRCGNSSANRRSSGSFSRFWPAPDANNRHSAVARRGRSLLPSPLDRPPVEGQNPKKEGKEENASRNVKDSFCGLVFKVIAQDTGDLYYIRIYSGVVKSGSRVLNPGRDGKEVLGKLFHVHADPKQRDELSEAHAATLSPPLD